MNEPQDGQEFVVCDRCKKTVDKEKAEPCEDIRTKEPCWICYECCAMEDYDQRSLDLFDA